MAAVGACDRCREDQLYLECCSGGILLGSARPGAHIPDGDEDRISALPDDMLLQVLSRLRWARAAAHTGLLARRWRGIWARLPKLVFHCTGPDLLDAALAQVARPAPSLLEIDIPGHHSLEPARVSSLLHTAAALAPVDLVVHVYSCYPRDAVELPCFDRTTSIKLEVPGVRFTLPPTGGFAALESLHLEDCCVDLIDLLPRCPCLRKLWIINWNSESVALVIFGASS
ncbi:hypothetical protein QOZ80_7BG0598930 [Eleusine coracana subsp. coracana]|nr:hypothetical protein QOZ80_7BG0598930 [Eleusine coracana subsp. coracana]